MSDLWKQCEGQFVDNQFRLLQFLGNTNHSAVFLTELRDPQPRKAAIKFISADIPAPDRQLAIWQRVEKLSHPHLLQIFRHGRCRLAGMELLYAIMERGDENLAQFLPQRPLNPQETRDVFEPLVDALSYLHGQSLSHSHVKPSNLLAIADQLKLSSDTILPMGDSREAYRDHDIYDAPENSAVLTIHGSAAADVWSLGVTLVETLTQQAPPFPFDDSAEPTIPESLPQPFNDIARHSLVRDPSHRWTIGGISAHLNPAILAAAASASASPSSSSPSTPVTSTMPDAVPTPVIAPASVSPLSVPLSTEPPIPHKKLPVQNIPLPRRDLHFNPDKTVSLPSYLIPIFLGIVLILGVIFTLPKIFRSFPSSSASTASTSVPAPVRATPAAPAKPPASSPQTIPPTQNSTKPPVETKSTAQTIPPTKPVETAAIRPATSNAAPLVTKSSSAKPERGDVLDKVLPEASHKALSTINGTVRVLVRVQVDPVGNVTSAQFDSPGPSKYFADLALRAAQRWQFASPVSEGHSLPSQWLIRFEFTRGGVTAIPAQQ